jgi:hypothetical protein
MLDEQFRSRIAGLADLDGDDGGLDEAARERILAHVRTEGPRLVRSARRGRLTMTAAFGGVAVAAAAALFVLRHPGSSEGASAKETTNRAVNGAVCAGRAVPESAAAGFVATEAGTRLDLGAVAVAAAEPGTVVRLTESSPCRTVIALDSGTVAVHAKDLGGGELRVHTARGDVVVHGTIFAVTEDASSLAVEVVVGNVSVTDRDDSHTVTTGQRLLLSAVGAARGPMAEERAHALRVSLGVPDAVGVVGLEALPAPAATTAPHANSPASPQVAAAPRAAVASRSEEKSVPVASVQLEADEKAPEATPPKPAAGPAVDPLALAEQARRAGDYAQARELYRHAAEGSGVTAEAAWVALARMELSLGHAVEARQATKRRQERFGRGTLGPEALWIDVRSYRQTGDLGKARELASHLVEQWPSSPQARAAEQWLSAH